MADSERGPEDHPMTSLPPPPLPPPPTAPSDKRSSRGTVAAGALGLTAGLAAWAVLGAYNENLAGFFGACLLLAGAYGAIAPRTAVPFGIGVVVGVTPLSMFTAHQGDGDGLWLLVIPMVAGFGLFTTGTAAVAASVIAPRIRSEDAVSRFVGDHVVLVCVPCFLLSVALVPITLSAYPDPWPDLEAVLDQASPPDEFVDQGTSRAGSPLQIRGGAPSLQSEMSSSLPAAETCAALREAISAWVGGTPDGWEAGDGSGDYLCGGYGSVLHAGRTYGVGASAWMTTTDAIRVELSVLSPDPPTAAWVSDGPSTACRRGSAERLPRPKGPRTSLEWPARLALQAAL